MTRSLANFLREYRVINHLLDIWVECSSSDNSNADRAEAANGIADYIVGFYNSIRLHSKFGNLSPNVSSVNRHKKTYQAVRNYLTTAAMRPSKRWVLDKNSHWGSLLEKAEQLKASVRAKVEHPFRVIKCQFGFTKVRYMGLAKNTAQLMTLFALSNVWIARRNLHGTRGRVRRHSGKMPEGGLKRPRDPVQMLWNPVNMQLVFHQMNFKSSTSATAGVLQTFLKRTVMRPDPIVLVFSYFLHTMMQNESLNNLFRYR